MNVQRRLANKSGGRNMSTVTVKPTSCLFVI
jgi:hypothetical protein